MKKKKNLNQIQHKHILSSHMETNDFLIKLGTHVKALRMAQKVSVKDLAQRTGKTQATIIRLEKGKDNIKILTLKQILQELNADFSTLFVTAEDVAFYAMLHRFSGEKQGSWALSKKILNVIMEHYNQKDSV